MILIWQWTSNLCCKDCYFRLPRDKQKGALDVPYSIFIKTGSYPCDIRRATIERVCLPMLRIVSKSALLEFFIAHIGQIKEFIEVKLSKVTHIIYLNQSSYASDICLETGIYEITSV